MPQDSFIRLTEEEGETWLPILEGIYLWESERVSGPWAGRPKSDIRNCTWTKSQMSEHLSKLLGNSFSHGSLDSFIEWMKEGRHILEIENPEDRFEIKDGERVNFPREGKTYITRMAEMVRTTGAIHEFPKRNVGTTYTHHQLVEGTKWEPRMRFRSPRDIGFEELLSKVSSDFGDVDNLPNGSTVADAINDLRLVLESIDEEFDGLTLSKFQFDSIIHSIKNSWSASPPHKALVITADTGAGKTLCFDIPAIVDALIENRMSHSSSVRTGMTQLLLYPRNDLAKDQRATLETYLGRVNDRLVDLGRADHAVSLGIDAGGLIKSEIERLPTKKGRNNEDYRIPWGVCKNKPNVYQSSIQKYSGGTTNRPANIMIAGIESFRRRLSVPKVAKALKKNLRRVVLDEIHLSNGTQGAHHAFMMKRLQQVCFNGPNTRLTFIGASATIAKPDEHTAKIWQCRANQVHHIDSANDSEGKLPSSIMNHILVRTRKGAAKGGSLVDITSLVGHQRRTREFHERPNRYKNLQKMIGFADSHDVVGNWHQLAMENERTTREARIQDPNNHNTTSPYAHWFSRPLEIHPGGSAICDSCAQGKKSENPITINQDDVRKISRKPLEGIQNAHTFEMQALLIEGDTISVSGLDDCPYLQAGTCWHFSPRTSETEERPGADTQHSYRDVLRVKKHTSKSGNNESNQDMDANHTFRDKPRRGAYPFGYVEGDDNHQAPHDVVIATPTLEVGIDMSNVTDVVTHKAIRNISSYRQKIGRGGRELGTDSTATTLMSARATDFIHYRSTSRLIDREIREPVPIANKNREVMRSEAYMAVFDWLSIRGHEVELATKARPADQNWGGWSESLRKAVKDLTENRERARTHCDYATGNSLEKDDLDTAISTAKRHLEALLTPYPTNEDKQMTIAHLVSWINRTQTRNPETVANQIAPILRSISDQCRIIMQQVGSAEQSILGISSDYDVVSRISAHASSSEPSSILELNDKLLLCIEKSEENVRNNPTEMSLNLASQGLNMVRIFIEQLSGLDISDEYSLVSEIKELDPRMGTSYLSQLLSGCNFFQQDSPYVMISTLFMNPYENQVTLRRDTQSEYGQKEFTTAKEAIRYYLPGMWTFKAFNGQPLRVKSGHLDGDPLEWVEHFNSDNRTSPRVQEKGTLSQESMSRVPLSLRADLHSEGQLPVLLGLQEIYLENETGFQRNLQQVPYNDDGFVVGFDVPQGGPMIPKRRPDSYSTSWDISKISNPEKVRSYSIPSMKKEFNNTIPVVKNPLINSLFSEVNWGGFDVQRLATCVTRSNGKRLRFRHNSLPAVFSDNFVTEGLEFRISDSITKRAKELSKGWRELPFNTLCLRALRSIIEMNNVVRWDQRYALESYIECLVQLSHNISSEDSNESFPRTFGEFMDIVTTNPLTAEIIDARAAHGLGDDQVENISDDILAISIQFISSAEGILGSMSGRMEEWTREAFCNTLSLLLQDSASAFSGVPADQLSYSFHFDSDGSWRIHLYDEDANGNGAMAVTKEFFQIPVEVRDANEHFSRGILPSSDFISEIERRMMTCPEHIAQSIAVENRARSSLLPGFVVDEANQLSDDYRTSWESIGAKSLREASLHNFRRYFISEAGNDEPSLDFLRQSLEFCDSGCPACNGDAMSNAYRGPLTEYYTCRSLLDTLVDLGPDLDGYLLKTADEEELFEKSGKPVEPYIDLDFHPVEGGNGLAKRLVHYHTPPIGIYWKRDSANEDPDWLVRHQEAI